MNSHIDSLIDNIRELEEELEIELSRRREELRFEIVGRKVRFEQEVLEQHRQLKTRLRHYIAEARPIVVLTAPVIYSLILPFALLDLLVSLYQAICFPVYGIPKVKRRDHLVFDRHRLGYLNAIEKFNCWYCSYGNGLLSFVREIAARTEQYWCPIKHARRVSGVHRHYSRFLDFGDAEAWRNNMEEVRCDFGPTDKSESTSDNQKKNDKPSG